jgi:DNA-binding LacI/PurR family transcriptional regulator
MENPVFPEMNKGFDTAASEEGYDLFLCATNYDANRTHAAVRKMIENGVRGVAIMTSSVDVEVAEQLADRQIAVVLLDTGVRKRFISNVSIDYCEGVREAVEHLKDLGHRRLAFVAGPDERRSARRYRETVLKAIQEHRLELDQIVECDQTLKGGRSVARKLAGNLFPRPFYASTISLVLGLWRGCTTPPFELQKKLRSLGVKTFIYPAS